MRIALINFLSDMEGELGKYKRCQKASHSSLAGEQKHFVRWKDDQSKAREAKMKLRTRPHSQLNVIGIRPPFTSQPPNLAHDRAILLL